MNNNIRRYSYTNFTNKPYIYYHGVTCSSHNNNNHIDADHDRSIIRTNQHTSNRFRR